MKQLQEANRETTVISFFHKAKNNPFLFSGSTVGTCGCLTDEIAIKRKNRDICNISFF